MRAFMRIWVISLMAALVLTGCDSYSITDQFTKDGESGSKTGQDGKNDPDDTTTPEPLTLTAEKSSVVPYGTIALYPVGGTKPYRFDIIEKDLYAGTRDRLPLGTVSESTFTAGTAIGSMTVRVVDAAEKTAEIIVTVLPPAPGNFAIKRDASTNSYKNAELSWTFDDPSIIDGFLIRRTSDGITYAEMSQGNTATSYIDSPIAPPTSYTYELIAVAGSFRSAAVTCIAPGQ